MKMQLLPDGRSQRGVAAVEFAVILPLLGLLIAFTLFFGRLFWHYTVAQKAAHDAVMMLATATKVDIEKGTPDYTAVEIAKLAEAIAEEEVAELNPGRGRPLILVTCDDFLCDGSRPKQVKVEVRMNMTDIFFIGFTDVAVDSTGLIIRAAVRMPYVGN